MLSKTLRDDQTKAIHELRGLVARGEMRVVLQAPCGFGKTLLICDIVDRARSKNKKILITVPTLMLIDQAIEAIATRGLCDPDEIGVIQAYHRLTDASKPIQVATVQTLAHRWRDRAMPQADIVMIDEVHVWFNYFSAWLQDPAWQAVPFIGFSATPWKKGLGAYYRKLIPGGTVRGLIEQHVLVPFRTFAPDMPDLSEVRQQAGEFVEVDLDRVMRPKKLVANIVKTWQELAADRVTVCFCCSRAHADQVAKEFNEAGICAAYLDCDTPQLERTAVRRRMITGEVRVICNVDVVGLGVDWPEVSCIIYARPTMSDIRFVQNIGRGLRACEGKHDLLILDHSTTTARLGFIDDVYDCHRALDDGKTKPKQLQGVALPKECPACHYLKPPRAAVCPNCGHRVEAHAKPVLCERGTLREFRPSTEIETLRKQLPDKANVYGQLVWWCGKKGYNPGWVANKYREIFGVWPRGLDYEDCVDAPVPTLLEYIYRSTQKWKRRQDYAKRCLDQKERAASANGMTAKEEAIIAKVREHYRSPGEPPPAAPPVAASAVAGPAASFRPGTLMTEQDVEDFK